MGMRQQWPSAFVPASLAQGTQSLNRGMEVARSCTGMAIRFDSGARCSGPACEDEGERFERLVQRVRGEFLEVPGLQLTAEEARRFWRLEEPLCNAILLRLVEARFLRRTREGAFVLCNGERH